MKSLEFAFEINWPLVNVKTMRKIAQIFTAFSEKLNFTKPDQNHATYDFGCYIGDDELHFQKNTFQNIISPFLIKSKLNSTQSM